MACEDDETSDRARAELIASIRRQKGPPNAKMALGRAMHSAVETGKLSHTIASTDGLLRFGFEREDVQRIREAIGDDTIAEVWGDLELPEVDVRLRLRADALGGVTVHEVKTRQRAPDIDKYLASCQWRCYLLAFECEEVRYHVAQLSAKFRLIDLTSFSQYRYAAIRDDVVERVGSLAEFIRSEGLGAERGEP